MGLIIIQIITGCQSMTAAQQEFDAMSAKIEAGLINAQACIQRSEATNKIDISLIRERVSFFDDSTSNKFELFSSNKKISDSEAAAFRRVLTGYSKCRQIILNTYLGTPFYHLWFEFYSQADILYTKLLSKQITIGTFNQQKSLLDAKSISKEHEVLSNYNKKLDDAHNAEVAQRQRAADGVRQTLHNQQMLMQQQQPVSTNCTQYGNQINCTSW